MALWQAYLEDMAFSFRKQKQMAEQAFGQLGDDEFFRQPAEGSNSVAVIVKHLAGNLKSRWTDFLTTDGDKPWRDRDGEFIIGAEDTRARLLAAWEEGWDALFRTLGDLGEEGLLKRVTIRGESHTVLQAIASRPGGLHDLVQGLYRYVYKLSGNPFILHDGSGAAAFTNFIGGDSSAQNKRQICYALPPDIRRRVPLCGGSGGLPPPPPLPVPTPSLPVPTPSLPAPGGNP